MPRTCARRTRGVGGVLVAAALLVSGLAFPVAASAATVTVTGVVASDTGGIDVHLAAPDALWVQATVHGPGNAVVSTDDLRYGFARGWFTDTPIRLAQDAPYGVYDVDVDYRLPEGPILHWSGTGAFGYRRHAKVDSITPDRTTTDVEHRTVTFAGTVSSYDPATGTTVAPAAGSRVRLTYTRPTTNGDVLGSATGDVDASGGFTVPVTPGGTVNEPSAQVLSPSGADEVGGALTAAAAVPADVSRVRLTSSPKHARVHAGSSFVVSGTAQRLTDDGWQPLVSSGMAVDATDLYGFPSGTRLATGNTDEHGHFAIRVTARRTTYFTAGPTDVNYLRAYSQRIALLSVPIAGSAVLAVSVDEYQDVHARGRLSSIACDGERVTLQYSRTGRSGWRSIRTAQAMYRTDRYCAFTISAPGAVDGYYRVTHAESDDMLATVSAAHRAYRLQTRITSFSTAPKRPAKNTSLTATGTLAQRVSGHWRALRNAKVGIAWRPNGSKTFYLMAKGTTTATGRFAVKAKAYGDGSWLAFYYADSRHFYTETGLRHVDVR